MHQHCFYYFLVSGRISVSSLNSLVFFSPPEFSCLFVFSYFLIYFSFLTMLFPTNLILFAVVKMGSIFFIISFSVKWMILIRVAVEQKEVPHLNNCCLVEAHRPQTRNTLVIKQVWLKKLGLCVPGECTPEGLSASWEAVGHGGF